MGFEAGGFGGSVASTVAPGAPLICTPGWRIRAHWHCYNSIEGSRKSKTHLESYHPGSLTLGAFRFGAAGGGKDNFGHPAGVAFTINLHFLRHPGPDGFKIKLQQFKIRIVTHYGFAGAWFTVKFNHVIARIAQMQTFTGDPVAEIQKFKAAVVAIFVARHEQGHGDLFNYGLRIDCEDQGTAGAGVAPFFARRARFAHQKFLLIVLECVREGIAAGTKSRERQLIHGFGRIVALRRKGGRRQNSGHHQASALREFRPTAPQDSLLLRTIRSDVPAAALFPQTRPSSARAECWFSFSHSTRAGVPRGSSRPRTPLPRGQRVRCGLRTLPAGRHAR